MAREVSSKILDGINDLVIMAPIREGFIEAYEPVTYATRLRIISEALNDIRATAREYENVVPFADASERILSLLDFKAGIIDNDLLQLDPALGLTPRRYFYLIATFDGVWEPYMRLIWRPLGTLLDLLFSNCEGYVFAEDNSYSDYINWVRSAQVDSAVFFATTGVTVQDQLYLRKLERLQRECDPGVAVTNGVTGDQAVARMALRNPALDAEDVRRADPLNANRLALEALGVFYRLADYYPPLAGAHRPGQLASEAYLLQRAVHRILEGWDYGPLMRLLNAPDCPGDRSEEECAAIAAQKAALQRFRPLIEWFASGANAFPSQLPQTADPIFDHREVQRGILSRPGQLGAHAKLRHGALLLMTVGDHRRAAAFVGALLAAGELSFEGDDAEPADGLYRTIGFTATGLERLAISRATLDAFPKEFREGLHIRAPQLGDVWDNHPRNWRLPERNWPPTSPAALPRPPVEMEEVDLVITLRHVAAVDDGGKAVDCDICRLAALAADHGVSLIAREALENQYDPDGHFRDHFGLRDNFSQPRPAVDAEPDPAQRVGAKRDDVRLGELLCGYGNDKGDYAPEDRETTNRTSDNRRLDNGKAARRKARRLQRDGSYLVIRKMSQDVAAFERFKEANCGVTGGDEKALIAKLLGRHPDGPSLVDPAAPDYNDFDYAGDTEGLRCPFAAHIRRANPRVVEHDRPSPRLLRAGMTYGPRYAPENADEPRGLMFMAYAASISEQYETIQRWLNGGNCTGVASANNDPLTGTAPRPDGQRTYRFEVGGRVVRTRIAEPFVRLEWGLYLFVPSRTALATIAETDRVFYELDEPLENSGKEVFDRLQRLATSAPGVAAAEWKRVLEDFDIKDISQRDITPDIYAAIRWWWGGIVAVEGGIAKGLFGDPEGGKDDDQKTRVAAAIAGSRDMIFHVLRDYQHFTVEEQLGRLWDTSGPIYVAEQPDDIYANAELESDYWTESTETNAIIDAYSYADGYDHGYAAGKAVLDWLIKDAEDRHHTEIQLGMKPPGGTPEFKMELRREYLAPALARVNRHWFGLPDGGFVEDGQGGQPAEFMAPGDWDWNAASDRKPLCPGDCLSPSRHAFYPRFNRVSEALAKDHGRAIRRAGKLFATKYFDEVGIDKVPGLISSQIFALPGMTKELAARNVIGIMLGATPPTLGNLQGIFFDWLNERTLWRHQAALRRAAGDGCADFAAAKRALLHPLSVALCKRPSPELLYRTCKGGTDEAPVTIERSVRSPQDEPQTEELPIANGTHVILPLASATQWAISREATEPGKLAEGVTVIFGGERGEDDAPVHACPGRKLAMGAMLGIVAALLDAGRIQAQPAGLIVRVSDWK